MKKYCIDCNKEITRSSKLGRCKSCAKKGKLNINFNKKMSLKQRKQISETRIILGIAKGYNNPNFKNKQPRCIDCNKLIHWQRKRCPKCDKIFKHLCLLGTKRPEQSLKMLGSNNPMYGRVVHPKPVYYKDICMNSTYETSFAKWCDKNNIHWLYESKTFDLGNTTYTPDFYLPEYNLYIETKGYWRDDAKFKFELFKIFYPEIQIELLMKKDLIQMEILK